MGILRSDCFAQDSGPNCDCCQGLPITLSIKVIKSYFTSSYLDYIPCLKELNPIETSDKFHISILQYVPHFECQLMSQQSSSLYASYVFIIKRT